MRIISFNLWGRFGPYLERWPMAAREIAKAKPDILCIQEATHEMSLDRVARAAGLSILIADVTSTGLAVLARLGSRASRLIEYETRSPHEPYIRKFQSIEAGTGHKAFRLINTHLSWKTPDSASRTSQARELADYLVSKPGPDIVCGDFNCEYSSKPLGVLRKEGYKDLLAGTPDEKKPTWDNANPYIKSHTVKFPDRRIDLILANKAFLEHHPLKSACIAFRKPDPKGLRCSDHYGIITEFK